MLPVVLSNPRFLASTAGHPFSLTPFKQTGWEAQILQATVCPRFPGAIQSGGQIFEWSMAVCGARAAATRKRQAVGMVEQLHAAYKMRLGIRPHPRS